MVLGLCITFSICFLSMLGTIVFLYLMTKKKDTERRKVLADESVAAARSQKLEITSHRRQQP